MFGHRSDGYELKTIPAEFRLMPSLMKERSDSQVMFKQDIPIAAIEEYIDKKAEEGIKMSIMDVVFAAVVRIIAERPSLNRFVVNGRCYARHDIVTAITIKKALSDEGEETSIKLKWEGNENIFDIVEKLQKVVAENKDESTENGTDKTADMIAKIPTGLIKKVVGLLKWMDLHGHLPKKIIEVSPFHTSAYVTNVGSIGIDAIYHHIYNFGTTSLFLAMGRKKKSWVFEDEELKEEKNITIGFVGDERICDGYYYASSFRQLAKYLKKPEVLEEHPERKFDVK